MMNHYPYERQNSSIQTKGSYTVLTEATASVTGATVRVTRAQA